MKPRLFRHALLGCVAIAGMTGALLAQESLLPPGFDKPAAQPARPQPAKAKPAAAPAAAKAAPAPAKPAATPAAPAAVASPVIQPLPLDENADVTGSSGPADPLDSIDPGTLDALIAKAQPKYDIPPSTQRSLARVGVIDQVDGGFPATSTHYLNGPFVEQLLNHMRGPMVSRWGHILVRRALMSRMDTPVGMNGADWAALRAGLLLRMGEADPARAMVQSVDSGFFTPGLEDAAMGAFLATADPVGLCPITALTAAGRQGMQWDLTRAICSGFTGDGPPAMAQLDRLMRRGGADKIDILLAQKLAGATSATRRAVNIEWKDVDQLTPWRTGMAFAVGIEPPQNLREQAWADYAVLAVRAPMLPLPARCAAADVAAGRGILSSAAMVDLYSQLAEINAQDGADQDKTWGPLADKLRTAYTAPEAADRLAAIKALWGSADNPDRAYSRLVLTAYAAARMLPSPDLAGDAGGLIASMLTAGLDANAARWSGVVAVGSEPWGLIALSAPAKSTAIGNAALESFQSGDDSSGALRSQFLLAGLMGLGRVDDATANAFAGKLKINMGRQTRWTRAIDDAAQSDNPALVALLAGFGMQAQSWDKMTAVHLYHIVSALRRVGLDGEARMIAAEAVARV
ncbi:MULTISPECIES: hypothetical protein [unclassified Novosphingobium]|uniref:hypothetical protein n=1 Tax=unclassified Novosphingobium TaxID=2644732 RepID=UPI00149463CE|nr:MULTISPECIES: hypothetical protein [unclassified Novosphingobium]MBB3357674.1 hypothetical protein [Novosphingobium sp. BK256]MBB3373662.1 hypothetical protein [Novosphingobium sp. BK280]MBB3378074.1 hypothetical protein [Novosphingobium sp. BK258]MBB3420141.1 hypothetical protein [Novosphingobium sp. BK267]MBB3447537.1 hypothetical protein [Novosphingobium sp. BK352]